jgi:DNA-binding response OmpR family regulator
LLDSGISNLDAIAVTRLIRPGKLGINRTAIIILIAHRIDRTFIFEAHEAGVTELVVQSFSRPVLMTQLVNSLERRRPFISSECYDVPCRRTWRLEPDIEPPRQRSEDQAAPRNEDLVMLARDAS